ncbi:MAG: two-component regulator propeller domain-containing protein [Bacteroidota bacterium]
MQKTKHFFLFPFIIALVLLAKQGMSQSYYFQNYSVENGLPFIDVSTIFQDSKGNLWSGGYGGLSKFDGVSFTNYSPKNGLLNHSVTCITEDNNGNLWIGTISGINKFNAEKFTGYTTKHGLISNSITASLKDANGNVWFGTDKGISKLTDGTFINYSTKNGLVGNAVNCIFQDDSGNVWIGTNEGISVFDQSALPVKGSKKIINYRSSDGLLNDQINSITQDLQHNIWIATSKGLCKLSDNKFTCYSAKEGLTDDNISSVLVDYRNTLWLATDNGLVKYNPKGSAGEKEKFIKYSLRKDKNSNLIGCLYQDYEHNLWIGTYAGLFKYRGNPFVSYGIEDGLTSQFIYGILGDSKGALWIGSKDGGLFKFENDKFTQFNEKTGLKAKTVNSIYELNAGTLWLGTDAGLTIYDGENFIKKADPSGVFDRAVNYIYKDSKNNIWLGGNDEIFKFDGKKFTRYTFKGRSENCQAWTIVEDLKGTLWIGTYLGGLIKFDPSAELRTGSSEFIECSESLGLKNDSYLTSLIDKEGNIYLGALDGLWMFNPGSADPKFTSFNESDGLSSDLIYAITFGKTENEIWAGTNQGLNKIDIAEFKRSGKKNIIPFGKEDGFSGVECNSNGTYVDKDGSIWFGTVNGLIKYDPVEYIENIAESKTSITGFRLFYNDTILTNKMHLSYNDNNITFYYSGISLTNPAKVQYSHILEGFDKWSPPSKERLVTYSNLPSGKYTFKVISSNNEGVWNKIPASFTFTINIPFWKTWGFIITLSLIVIGSFTFFIRLRIRKIRNLEKRKTELNRKIANIESQALRAQMNPHFIFNTLSSIQHYISNHDTDAALKYLSKFAKLMRKIMENSKQQMITVAEEINALNLFLELEVMRFDKKFEYHISIDPNIDQNYDRIPSMLIQPYVENAIIHGLLPKQGFGKISIALQKQNDTILCIVEDTGIGRENSKKFKKNSIQQHKSMGMSITQERLDILNASLSSNINCEIIDQHENGEPAGTKVLLVIPLEVNE